MHSYRVASQGQDATAAHAIPLHDPVLCAWRDQLDAASLPISLKHHLRTHEQVLLPCFVAQYTKLKALPRRMRRSLQREWKRSLAGVALLMALSTGSAVAAQINMLSVASRRVTRRCVRAGSPC